MIRFATIGTSSITKEFLRGAKLSGRLEHTAVYSRDKERGEKFAEFDGCKKVYTSLSELAKDSDIDAVYIASVNSCHAEQSRIMLEAGKHVICEKPIATTVEEYKSVKSLADKKGLIYLEAITSHHSPTREKLKSAIRELGTLSQVRIDFCQRSSRLDRHLRGEHINVFDMSLRGGALMDLGVYCIYCAVDLFGVPEKIASSVNYLSNGADCGGAAIFSYKNLNAAITYSKTGQSFAGSEIIGQKGTLTIGSCSQYTDIKLIKDGKATVVVPDIEKPEIMVGEATDFADFIEHFENNKEKYERASKLCLEVHCEMDEIIRQNKIKYN